MHFVYILLDPTTGEVGYVGITNNPIRRLFEHRSCLGKNKHKDQWIRGLQEGGIQPNLQVIEVVFTPAQAREREEYWINRYAAHGAPLTNIALTAIGIKPLRERHRRGEELRTLKPPPFNF